MLEIIYLTPESCGGSDNWTKLLALQTAQQPG